MPTTVKRPIVNRRSTRRAIARVGGISRKQADDVGEEAGRQQQGAADHDQHAVGDLLAGEAALGERLVEAPPGAAALVAQQQRAEQRVGEQQRQRRPDADQLRRPG